jgi:hypothetical protein
MSAYDNDPVLETPHCPECHSNNFRTARIGADPKKWERECTLCGHTFLPQDSLIIEKYRYGE